MRLLATAGALLLPAAGPAAAESAPPRFVMACAPCHGFDGKGHDPSIPNLAGQSAIYLYNQMAAFRAGARRHSPMDFFAGQMTAQEMQEIAAYYAGLAR